MSFSTYRTHRTYIHYRFFFVDGASPGEASGTSTTSSLRFTPEGEPSPGGADPGPGMGAGAGAVPDGGAVSNAGISKNAEKSSPSPALPGEAGYTRSGKPVLFTWLSHESNDHGSWSEGPPEPKLEPVGNEVLSGVLTCGKDGLLGSKPMSRMRVWILDWRASMSALIAEASL